MAPLFNLPMRTKPPSHPVTLDGRIAKSTTNRDDLATMTLEVVNSQVSGKQVEPTKDDTQMLASILAGRCHETNRNIARLRPQRKYPAPIARSSLITSDAAADALASLERPSLDASTTGVPIVVSFYSLDTLEELTNGIAVTSSEAEDLIDLTTIMLRRGRFFFRECDLTERPPLMWRFTVHHRHVVDTYYKDDPEEGKLVVRNTYSETCIAAGVQTDHGAAQTARPDEAYLRFLGACRDWNTLKILVDDNIGKDMGLTYGRVRHEPFDTKMFSDETDKIIGSVDLWFSPMATITSPRTESPSHNLGITSPSLASPSHSTTGTPSTSSLDLSRTDAQTAPPTAQRRNRAALRDYYNLKSKQPPHPASGNLSRTASIASTTSDSTITSHLTATKVSDGGTSPFLAQLDDPSFRPQPFIDDLLSKASLRDILRTESTLVSEIRNLDGERKALVYDNYSKLIKAVGTIGEMQRGMQKRSAGGDGGLDGVEGLKEKMAGLEGMVRTLVTEDVGVEGRERRRRRKEKGVVRWVLGAPERIAGLVAEGRREDAEMEFARVKRVLDEWEGVEGAEQVRHSCQEAMSRATRNSEDG